MLRMLRLPQLVTNRAPLPLHSAFATPRGLVQNHEPPSPTLLGTESEKMMRMLRLPPLVTNRAKTPLHSTFPPPWGLVENQDSSKPPNLPCRSVESEKMSRMLRLRQLVTNRATLPLHSAFATPRGLVQNHDSSKLLSLSGTKSEMFRMLGLPRLGTNIAKLPLRSAFATPCGNIVRIHSSSSIEPPNLIENPTNKKEKMDCEVQKIKKEIDPNYDLEGEAKKLLKDVECTIKEVQESKFYARLVKELKRENFNSSLRHVLGFHAHMQMVIYGLGSIEFSYASQYQLAIAILLKWDFAHWVGDIEVFDPMISPADTIVLEKLGCTVLSVNENCSRQVEKPTLFFMPLAANGHLEWMLEANWCPSRINQVILLTNRVSGRLEGLEDFSGLECLKAIEKHSKEIKIANYYEFIDFAWHFFPVPPDMDMESLVPDAYGKERREAIKMAYVKEWAKSEATYLDVMKDVEESWIYSSRGELRGPCRYRISANLPYPGIYFSGKGCDENSPAGFGSMIYNQYNKPQATICGPLGEVDVDVASVEALRKGLELLKTVSPPVEMVRVVGDNLSVVRWVRLRAQAQGCKPPERVRKGLDAVFDLMKGLKACLVFQIYEDANVDAIEMAKKGAKEQCLSVNIYI